ncbi:MAG: MurT ligase domain-containing protein [Chloroflexota bacterium]|nr:MurT ligase domain-containing protein [Chloroflexota bacterium]
MPLRRPAAALAGRTAGWISRLTRRGGGTAVSGLVTSVLDPNFVPASLSQLHSTITVTGTNGKTTTTAALCSLARAAGQRVLTNPTGSNLERGLAAALLPHVGWNGQVREASQLRAILELDEWAFASLAPTIRPRVAVFLNLFRDQLDRYGEVDRTAAAWQDVIDSLDASATVVANADDPAVVAVARRHRGPLVFFGVDIATDATTPDAWADVRRCPVCDGRLDWNRVVYAHLGSYRCRSCDFHRPKPDVRITDFQPRGLAGSCYRLITPDSNRHVEVKLPGLYNAYNLAAAVTGVRAAGIETDDAGSVLETFQPAFGRAETILTPGGTIVLLLVKNPTGANQTLDLLRSEPDALDTLVLLNDGVADGEDVSWIWDVEFERLSPRRLVVGGRRAEDLALRLKYAGVAPAVDRTLVCPGVGPALDAALASEPGGQSRRLIVLATYTAMLDLRAVCTRRGWVDPYWRAAT